jgi:hypothetical protein
VDHRLFGTGHLVVVVSTGSLPFGVGPVERGASGWVVLGTLLGPEGSGVFLPAFFSAVSPVVRTAFRSVVGCGGARARVVGLPPVF